MAPPSSPGRPTSRTLEQTAESHDKPTLLADSDTLNSSEIGRLPTPQVAHIGTYALPVARLMGAVHGLPLVAG